MSKYAPAWSEHPEYYDCVEGEDFTGIDEERIELSDMEQQDREFVSAEVAAINRRMR